MIITSSSSILPSNILNQFTITKIESDDHNTHIYLDERATDKLLANPTIESAEFKRIMQTHCYLNLLIN